MPSPRLIGVIDFFAVLVPGIVAAALIVNVVRATPQADILFISGLVTVGWVLEHVLHSVGSWLDPLLYDRLFKPRDTDGHEGVNQASAQKSNRLRARIQTYLHKNDNLYRLAKVMTDVPDGQNGKVAAAGVPGGMYQWARAWLNSHSPEATAGLDRIEQIQSCSAASRCFC